jgi:HPt (histidine-containing phosphotransfer) domain-containing protein
MSQDEIIDIQDLRTRMEDDMDLLRELSEVFLSDYSKLLGNITDAVMKNDSVMLARSAHTIKGAVANFSARRAYAAALALENMGKTGDMGTVEETLGTLKETVEEFRTSLLAIIEKGTW